MDNNCFNQIVGIVKKENGVFSFSVKKETYWNVEFYGRKIWITGWPLDGTCLVESFDEPKTICQKCNVDFRTRIVSCDLRGYKGTLKISYVESSDNEKVGLYVLEPNTGREIWQYFSVSKELVQKRPEKKVPEKLETTLWAGTVGLGLSKDGQIKELHRTKEQAWKDFIGKGRSFEWE